MDLEASKKKFTWIQGLLIIGFIIVVIAICIIAYQMLKPEEKSSVGNGSLVVDESNLAEIQEKLSGKEADGMFEINMNTVWGFADGSSASYDAYLANGSANWNPISFEVILDKEVIYTSTVIPVGNMIKEIVLDKDLDAGEYNAICKYTLWNEDGTEESSFNVNIKLVVEG